MTPNYICPCCGYRASLTEEMFRTVLQVVAEDYRLSTHDVEWATHAPQKSAQQARAVVVYLLKMLSGCMNKEINVRLHWPELSSNTTHKFYQVVTLYEDDHHFARRLDELSARVSQALAPIVGRNLENISPLHAISE
jgi:NADH:ubiquinone oxidoreductase subunit C